MSKKNSDAPSVKHRIVIDYDEATSNIEFMFSPSNDLVKLGMLELCKEEIHKNTRTQQFSNLVLPRRQQ